MKLLLNACAKYLLGLVMICLLLFLPAGTLNYPNGWLFLALLFLPMLLLGAVLFLKAPGLLKKRLSTKEKQQEQKRVVALSGLIFLAGFLLCGLDFRFGWSHLPVGIVTAASVLFLLSYGLYAEVMRENAYLSRTVEVQEGQKVIDTGLYGVIRHPMYTATLGMFLTMPLILGSFYGFLCFLFYPILIVRRIANEEQVLERELEGYADYKTRVTYRLIPFLW
ncbi:MAG: isoprenylcysteine carboxylmethyltransferase family protein [Oscillospiraceae bacterium]|nr:isoprenylcysteine carboxylmethyltransferase family protein [Oscillospiraceae bacterium]